MKVFVINRKSGVGWCENYKGVVVAEDARRAERFARIKVDGFRKAKLEVKEVDLEAGEQVLSIENTGA